MFSTNEPRTPPVLIAGHFRLIASELDANATHASRITACCIGDDGAQLSLMFETFEAFREFLHHHAPRELYCPEGSRLAQLIGAMVIDSAPRVIH